MSKNFDAAIVNVETGRIIVNVDIEDAKVKQEHKSYFSSPEIYLTKFWKLFKLAIWQQVNMGLSKVTPAELDQGSPRQG
jgi:hypothetical protein